MTDLFDMEFEIYNRIMNGMETIDKKRQEIEQMKDDILEAEKKKLKLF